MFISNIWQFGIGPRVLSPTTKIVDKLTHLPGRTKYHNRWKNRYHFTWMIANIDKDTARLYTLLAIEAVQQLPLRDEHIRYTLAIVRIVWIKRLDCVWTI